jgi:hypothetical protein
MVMQAARTERAGASARKRPISNSGQYGYGFQLDQGLQALQRTHAAAGNLELGMPMLTR